MKFLKTETQEFYSGEFCPGGFCLGGFLSGGFLSLNRVHRRSIMHISKFPVNTAMSQTHPHISRSLAYPANADAAPDYPEKQPFFFKSVLAVLRN